MTNTVENFENMLLELCDLCSQNKPSLLGKIGVKQARLIEMFKERKNIILNQSSNGWISVDDDNPTTDDFVFVLLLGKFPALGKYINNVWHAQALGSSYVNDMDGHRVTHWQPLSPLPEE